MPTVHELRNAIRVAVGRFERVESTSFTKESLSAICEAVDADVELTPTPTKPAMRAAILAAVGEDGDGSSDFRKAELQAIAAAVDAEAA
jgi:hypothetical protein